MRLLVVTDIHGNRYGLETVLAAAADDYDGLLCLGDVVGYGAHPNECCEMLRDRDAWCLLGNHDAAALGLIGIQWFNPVAQAAIRWTRDQLSPDNAAWLAALPPQRTFSEHACQAVHGSLREPLEEYITGPDTAEPNLLLMTERLCLFGHTHVAVCYRAPGTADARAVGRDLEEAELSQGGLIALDDDHRYLLNPGSCGQPRDGNPQTRYALYDTVEGELDVVALDYDVKAARDAILAAGLPQLLGDRLLQGR